MTIENKKIGLGDLAKLVVSVTFIIGYTIAIYSWVSNIDKKVDLMIQTNTLQHEVINKQLDNLNQNADDSRKVQAELIRAIDKTSILLDQVNKKMEVAKGKP